MNNKITYYSQVLNVKKMAMIFLFGLSFLSIWAHPETNNLRILKVVIYGESNVMNFWLKYNYEAIGNIKQSHIHTNLDTENTEKLFTFPVDEFIAPNRQIKTDFNRMLRSDENPNIYIQFDEIFCDQITMESNPQYLEILLKIGGVERVVSVECNSEDSSASGQLFKGKAIIHLADFELEAPNHLLGLIKVKDTIMITFEFQVLSQ